ncbi:hypothetical protein Poly30_37260 [Planctomycetes bacterium Poly30]|uniref:Phosphotransferase enzyme family protein n=1 Tax=Saltatorellus ferox TaxID=2528018 RepID=A0A518EVS3_9BACT|nr:hypothetical protein Poly30_37260 [Planctomycetes bacterium Poly30]
MIGLTQYARDLSLPAQLGDSGLVPPSEREILDLVNERLCARDDQTGSADLAVEARVVHVRYKPGVALAATYAVRLEDGGEHAVTYKVHLGDKVEDREVGGRYAEQLALACAPLRPFALLAERHASLWVFPADPKLRGAVRAHDMHRVARWIDRLGVAEPFTVRLRPSVLTLRRYKHSRRAVFHVLAKLRGESGARDVVEFGLRVLTSDAAARSAERRMGLAALDLPIPKCLGHDPVAGWILEEWLEGVVAERDDLLVAGQALRCAARLHRAPHAGVNVSSHGPAVSSRLAPLELLRGIQGADELPARFRAPLDVPATHWIHSDLHPDQVLIHGDGASLLDLDDLRSGAVEEDLASWAADAAALSTTLDADEMFGELVDLYREVGGGAVDLERLRALTCIELLERAAASVRRLESGALSRAERLLSSTNSLAASRK